MVLANLKNDLADLEQRVQSWRLRAESALNGIEASFGSTQRQAIIELLTQVHRNAAQAVAGNAAESSEGIPWELAHGLSALGLSDGEPALPRTPEDFKTVVRKDGTLLGCRQWELLDPRWAEALIQWLEHIDKRAPFGTTPALLTMPNDVVLAIAGDWGTGAFETGAASIKIGALMRAAKPDYSLHLGDVYYAGTGTEERNDMADWPQGSRGSFTLNSNHEMYNGAFGYFAELAERFPLHQSTSYFALQNDHWLVVGLDSAYYSERFNLYMKGKLDAEQVRWLGSLPRNKRVMILSHHEGYDALGEKPTDLYQQVKQAIGRDPDFWYWGHLHNGIVYRPRSGFQGRCIGHGAIPYGNASMLAGQPNVAWYETTLAGDANYPERVLNGWAKISLSGASITEQVIGEDGSIRWSA